MASEARSGGVRRIPLKPRDGNAAASPSLGGAALAKSKAKAKAWAAAASPPLVRSYAARADAESRAAAVVREKEVSLAEADERRQIEGAAAGDAGVGAQGGRAAPGHGGADAPHRDAGGLCSGGIVGNDMVVPTSVGFLIPDSRYGGYGIAQYEAWEKSLLGLPVLAAAASADVIPSLEALSRPSAVPLFELRGNPRSGSSGSDGDDFLLEGAILLARGVPGFWLRRCWNSCWFGIAALGSGLVGSAVIFPLFGPSTPCLSAPDSMFTPACVRVMCCTPLYTHSTLSINAMIRKLCVFAKKENRGLCLQILRVRSQWLQHY